VNRRTRFAPLLSLGLLLTGAIAAAAQPSTPAAPAAPAPAVEESLPRWDTFGFIGWRGARGEDTYYSSYRWDARFAYGGAAGYYWTTNLKLEVDVSGTTPSRFYEYRQREYPGAPYPLFFRTEHRVVTGSLGGTLIYQFFENASFHPFLGAGVGVITIRDRVTTERQSQVFSRTPGGPVEVVVIAEAETHDRTDNLGRGLIVAGFKAYPGERVFFRSDVQWSTGSRDGRDVTWRLGVGVDF
jgi:hypothetical protein